MGTRHLFTLFAVCRCLITSKSRTAFRTCDVFRAIRIHVKIWTDSMVRTSCLVCFEVGLGFFVILSGQPTAQKVVSLPSEIKRIQLFRQIHLLIVWGSCLHSFLTQKALLIWSVRFICCLRFFWGKISFLSTGNDGAVFSQPNLDRLSPFMAVTRNRRIHGICIDSSVWSTKRVYRR